MLELNDPRWQQLHSNYTNGAHVAELLTLAGSGTDVDRWYDDLFQELCHQYTVSEAAYAALPHLVEISSRLQNVSKELIVLAAACYTFATQPGAAEMPAEFETDWHTAARSAIPAAAKLLADPISDESDLRYLLFSLAAFNGKHDLAITIESLDTLLECPNCGFLIERMQSN
jgi:hypothetical protein